MKVRARFCLAMVLAVCFAASVAHATWQDDVDQAVSIIERFEEIPESAIPLGGNLSAAIGPIGRSAEAGVAPQAAIYTYSRSQGIFAGVSLEGTVVATRYEANEEFYGKPVFPADILAGSVKPPPGVQKLLDVLAKY